MARAQKHLAIEFRCNAPGCDKVYHRKAHLKRHVLAIHERYSFDCIEDGCERSFRYKHLLDDHYKTQHPLAVAPHVSVSVALSQPAMRRAKRQRTTAAYTDEEDNDDDEDDEEDDDDDGDERRPAPITRSRRTKLPRRATKAHVHSDTNSSTPNLCPPDSAPSLLTLLAAALPSDTDAPPRTTTAATFVPHGTSDVKNADHRLSIGSLLAPK